MVCRHPGQGLLRTLYTLKYTLNGASRPRSPEPVRRIGENQKRLVAELARRNEPTREYAERLLAAKGVGD